MRSHCSCSVDLERRWIFTRGPALVVGPLMLNALPAYPAGPWLWIWRVVFGRTIAREQMRFLGGVAGQTLRTAVAPSASRAAMSWGQAIGVASSATILAVGATQLAEVYSPEWFARLRGRIADFTVNRHATNEQRLVGTALDEPWSGPPANLLFGSRYLPADPNQEAPPTSISHQRLVLPGEAPGASAIELDAPPGVYGVEPYIIDLDRQQVYIASGGGLPPPIVKFE